MNCGLEYLDPSVFGADNLDDQWKENLPSTASIDGFEMNSHTLNIVNDGGLELNPRTVMDELPVDANENHDDKMALNDTKSDQKKQKKYACLGKPKPRFVGNPPKRHDKYVSITIDQLIESQKESLIAEVLRLKSFVKPSREFGKKWGVLIPEYTVKKLYDEHMSKFPPEEASPEMLELQSNSGYTSDPLTLAEKFEIVDLCQNMKYTEAAQLVYDRFGKAVTYHKIRTMLKLGRVQLNVSVEDRVGIINMAEKEGIVKAARFYSDKCGVDISEAAVVHCIKFAEPGYRPHSFHVSSPSCNWWSLSVGTRKAVMRYANRHTNAQTANKYFKSHGILLSEATIRSMKGHKNPYL